MIVRFEEIRKSYGENEVLNGLSAQIDAGDRIGMVGVNGAGKSTLLGILCGEITADGGSVTFGKDVTVGYLRQNTALTSGRTVYEEMRSVFSDVLATARRMEELREALANAPEGSDGYRVTAARLEEATRCFEAADGYGVDVKIATVLTGLGFDKTVWQRVVDTFSGGERVRLALGRLLLTAPDLMVLDEPTNHLDFETLHFLEEQILSFKGAVLMVSHDRYFLDRTAREIWEIGEGRLIRYPGNYTKYKALAAERRREAEKEREKYLLRRAELTDYIARNGVRASTAAMAKSRERALEKLEEAPPPAAVYQGMKFAFSAASKSGQDVLSVRGAGASPGGRALFENVCMEVKRGEKIALVGPNGVGKTTLFRLFLEQADGEKGAVLWGKNTRIGHFDQHGEEIDNELTALEAVRDGKAITPAETRSLLARVQIRGEAVYQKCGSLSGGQRAAVALARLMLRGDNVLMLDEPTNHLDLVSRENLERALADYDGTLLMISHDRYLLRNVARRIYALSPTGVTAYDGFDEYLAALTAPKEKPSPTVKGNTAYHKSKKERARVAALRRREAELEREIGALEEETAALEKTLTGSDYEALAEACRRIEDNKARVTLLTDEWLTVSEQLGS